MGNDPNNLEFKRKCIDPMSEKLGIIIINIINLSSFFIL